jgi:ABC-type glycerol-3-phosphate transport system permease component
MPSYPTIAVGLYEVRESFTNDRPVYFSAMIISIIPVIALFIAFSDVIMNNISIGGLKG